MIGASPYTTCCSWKNNSLSLNLGYGNSPTATSRWKLASNKEIKLQRHCHSSHTQAEKKSQFDIYSNATVFTQMWIKPYKETAARWRKNVCPFPREKLHVHNIKKPLTADSANRKNASCKKCSAKLYCKGVNGTYCKHFAACKAVYIGNKFIGLFLWTEAKS